MANIVAIIPTYNPAIDVFSKVVTSLVDEVSSIIIIDNGSDNIKDISYTIRNQASLLSLSTNMGQAYALNAGVKEALKQYPEWILTIDQNSIMERNAFRFLEDFHTKDPKLGIISMSNNLPSGSFQIQKKAITNGNLVRANVYKFVRYRDEFFIDQVDFDFCQKTRKAGFYILSYKGGIHHHEVGRKIEKGRRKFFFEPDNRFYYIVRNSTVMLREGTLTFYEYISQIFNWLPRLVEMEGIKAGLVSLFWGLYDGINGRLGKNPRHNLFKKPF